MKYILKIIYVFVFAFPLQVISQIPYTTNVSGSYNSTTELFTGSQINAGTFNNTPFNVSNTAKVELKASTEIKISNETSISNITGNGEFWAHIDPAGIGIASFHNNGFNTIPTYDRFEIGVKLPTNIQNQVNAYLAGGTGLNPFDLGQVRVEVDYKRPSEVVIAFPTPILVSGIINMRQGFYYEPYTNNGNVWVKQSTDYSMRVRYAPPVAGTYTATVKLFIYNTLTAQSDFKFNVYNSGNPGHLIVRSSTLRLTHERGGDFFGIGQNAIIAPNNVNDTITFAGPPYNGVNPNFPYSNGYPARMSNPSKHQELRDRLNDLADKGGNFVRARMDSWSFPMQTYDKSPNPIPVVQTLDNYNHNQMFMQELDKTITVCETRGIKCVQNILHDIEYYTGLNSGEELWAQNPYNTICGQGLPGIKNFFTQPLARAKYKNMLHYIHARWGYSTAIGIWSMINEIEPLGRGAGDAFKPYMQDPVFRQQVNDWVREMKWELEQLYPWHPTTCGAQGYNGDFIMKDHQPNCLNVYSQNPYNSNVDVNGKGSNNGELEKKELHLKYFNSAMPFFVGETGLTGKNESAIEIEKINDRTFHNTLWATAMMGGISTALSFWNQQQDDGVDHRANFKALRHFFDNQVPLYKKLTPQFEEGKGESLLINSKIFNYSMVSDDKETAIGWARNGSADWTIDYNGFPDALSYLKEDGRFIYNPDFKSNIPAGMSMDINKIEAYDCLSADDHPSMTITNLLKKKRYRVQIFSCYGNTSDELENFHENTGDDKKLEFKRFMPAYRVNPFAPDYAFKATYDPLFGNNRVSATDSLSTNDSLCLHTDEWITKEQHFAKHNWYINNSYIGKDSTVCTGNLAPGVNTIKLVVYDSLGISKQSIVKTLFVKNNANDVKISVYPNPTNDYLYVNMVGGLSAATYKITNVLGQVLQVPYSNNTLNVVSLPNGAYVLTIKTNQNEKQIKFIVAH